MDERTPDAMFERGVSVIVPTRNNERTLEATLRSVKEQSEPGVTLIVVDNASTDATKDIARRWADVYHEGGPERSAQRNRGIEAAQTPWIVWLDSDMILPPRAIEVALDTAQRTGADGVALPERTIGDGFWTACRALERECYLDQPWLHNPRLLRRDFMRTDGEFHLAMSGPEDADCGSRCAARVNGSSSPPSSSTTTRAASRCATSSPSAITTGAASLPSRPNTTAPSGSRAVTC